MQTIDIVEITFKLVFLKLQICTYLLIALAHFLHFESICLKENIVNVK